jgi:hypothetical protein
MAEIVRSENLVVYGQTAEENPLLVGTYGYHEGTYPETIPIRDYAQRATDLLIEQFENKPLIQGFVALAATRIQDAEVLIFDLILGRLLVYAVGQQLDNIGAMIGESRQGKNDDEYCIAIEFQIRLNRSSGEPETLIDATMVLAGATVVQLMELFPGAVGIYTDGEKLYDAGVKSRLQALAPAGVRIWFYSLFDGIPFSCEWDGVEPSDGSLGFDELNYYPGGVHVGGQLVEFVQ